MWLIIAKKEIKQVFRSRNFILSGTIVWILLLVATISGLKNFSTLNNQQQAAKEMFDRELAQEDRNPHSAAHFGTYLFKPITLMGLYDPGINAYAGIVYRVEAHKQSEMYYSSSQDSDGIMRFGELSISSVFQLLIPLVIIFIAFDTITKEREDGTWKILLAQGASIRHVLWGKILGTYILIIMIVLPVFTFILITNLSDLDLFFRSLYFVFGYSVYFFIIIGLAVCGSYLCKTSGIALFLLLCSWIWICVISPRFVAGIALEKYPLISHYQFSKLTDKDFFQGLGKDGTYSERRQKLEKQILTKYRVDSASQLPVNLEGLLMQDAEDYNSMIFHLRSQPIEKQLNRQKNVFQSAAYLSPYLMVKQISMSLAGTDLYHHQDFHHKAGKYRDEFVKTLNMELSKSKPGKETYQYKVKSTFFANMKKFEYKMPGVSRVIGNVMPLLLTMLFWVAFVLLFVEINVRKNIKI